MRVLANLEGFVGFIESRDGSAVRVSEEGGTLYVETEREREARRRLRHLKGARKPFAMGRLTRGSRP